MQQLYIFQNYKLFRHPVKENECYSNIPFTCWACVIPWQKLKRPCDTPLEIGRFKLYIVFNSKFVGLLSYVEEKIFGASVWPAFRKWKCASFRDKNSKTTKTHLLSNQSLFIMYANLKHHYMAISYGY